MAWDASDFALIIGTTATAITALSGVVWPVWQAALMERKTKKRFVFEQILSPLMFCIENADRIGTANRNRRIGLAYSRVGAAVFEPGTVERRDHLWDEFNSNKRKVELYAKRYGLDATRFVLACGTILSLDFKYSVHDGKLLEDGDLPHDELIRKEVNAISEMVEGAKDLMEQVENKTV